MATPVIAKTNLEGYILDTSIVVNIPQGTEGHLVQEVRNDIVIVQFNVPSLGPLRVNRRDLMFNDTLESIIAQAERMLKTEPFVESEVHRALDDALLRALDLIATADNKKQVNYLINLFKNAPKNYTTSKK